MIPFEERKSELVIAAEAVGTWIDPSSGRELNPGDYLLMGTVLEFLRTFHPRRVRDLLKQVEELEGENRRLRDHRARLAASNSTLSAVNEELRKSLEVSEKPYVAVDPTSVVCGRCSEGGTK